MHIIRLLINLSLEEVDIPLHNGSALSGIVDFIQLDDPNLVMEDESGFVPELQPLVYTPFVSELIRHPPQARFIRGFNHLAEVVHDVDPKTVNDALIDALFNVLPLGTDLDKVEATPARAAETLLWADTAQNGLDRIVAAQPILVRISAAKRLRDAAEQVARAAGVATVEIEHVQHASESLQFGDAA